MPSTQRTALDGDRTLDRRLVHRSAVSEVFLTDVAQLGESSYAVAVHVPAHHHYYADHSTGRPIVDPLFLLEAARQAQACVAHGFLGVPADHRFVVRSTRFSSRVRLLTDAVAASSASHQVVLAVEVSDVVTVRGETRSATFSTVVLLRTSTSEVQVADVSIAMSYVPPESYAFLRGESTWRGAAFDVQDTERDLRVPAESVGRGRIGNVVLEEPRHGAEGSTAVLRPAYDNSAMFDHAQDHVPAMVLIEAARQLVVHRSEQSSSAAARPDGLDLWSVEGAFHAFVEHAPAAQLRLSSQGHADLVGAGGTSDGRVRRDDAGTTAFAVAVIDARTSAVLADLVVTLASPTANAANAASAGLRSLS